MGRKGALKRTRTLMIQDERDGTGEAAAHSDSWRCWFSFVSPPFTSTSSPRRISNHVFEKRAATSTESSSSSAPLSRPASGQSISSPVSAVKGRADPRRPYLRGADSIHAAVRHFLFLPADLCAARRQGQDCLSPLAGFRRSARAVKNPQVSTGTRRRKPKRRRSLTSLDRSAGGEHPRTCL